MKKAEITAFLGLIFILLVTFIGSITEAASVQVAKNYRRTDAERAIECVFAEFQTDLLEQYDVFALDTTYETGTYTENKINKRLEFYGLVNSKNNIERIKFLTDDNGKPFVQQAICYMKHKYGVDIVDDRIGKIDLWEGQKQKEDEYRTYLEEIQLDEESGIPIENNPIAYIEELMRLPILNVVFPNEKTVSEKEIAINAAASHREINVGYGEFSDENSTEGIMEKLLFGEYLAQHFRTAVEDSEHPLEYELEYILAGHSSDKKNLQDVLHRLILFRFVSNLTYLQTNLDKKAQAESLALALCALLATPGLTEVTTQGILLAWAYGESIADLRSLLNGEKIPLVKKDASWQLSMAALLQLKNQTDAGTVVNEEGGLDYKDYLQILLFFEDQGKSAMRALDLVEQNLRKINGLEFFKVDCCLVKIETECTCILRQNIKYTFPIYYSYK